MFHSDTHIDLAQPYLVDTRESAKTFTRTQIQASLAVSMGSLIVGYSSAWSSPAIASLMEPGGELEVTTNEASWIGSLMPLAALIGGFIGGSLLEALGRKNTILLTALPFITAGLLVSFAQDVYMIYAGRAITGFCIGVISLSLPVYLAETISPEVRGTLGLLPTSLGNLGVMLCYIFGFWLDWSYLSLVGAIIPLPFLLMVCTIPETPRFLVAMDKGNAARASLQWLRGPSADITTELNAIEAANILALKTKFKLSELARMSYLKPMFVSMGLMFFQQFSGINAVLFYSVSIFRSAGSTIDSNLATIILGIVNIGATICSNVLIDRLGRKILLYISLIGMICSLGVFGAYFYLRNSEIIQLSGVIPLVALVVYIIAFSVGFGPIPWLMMGEIFPARIRGPAASISTAFNWACTFIVTKTFMDLQVLLGQFGVFWLFAGILVVSSFFVIFVVPETRGKTLEDIERLYMERRMSFIMEGKEAPPPPTYRRVSSIANLKATPSQFL